MAAGRRPEEDRSEDGSTSLPDCGDAIDPATFEQILEMDDDDSRDFSRELVFGFFDQAAHTFREMEENLKDRKLESLSSLGHYLKGSSATLGLTKVQDSCEKIQHYGARKDESGDHSEPDDSISLRKIKETLAKVQVDCADAEGRLRAFYNGIES